MLPIAAKWKTAIAALDLKVRAAKGRRHRRSVDGDATQQAVDKTQPGQRQHE
jgi:hypothetical protein